MPRGEACAGCPYKGGLGVVVSAERRRGGLAFLGEGPAKEEVSRGQVFIGRSGGEWEWELRGAGIARAEISVENAHQCARPKHPDRERQAVIECRPRVAEFLEEVRPVGVALLGGKALRSVCPAFVAGGGGEGILRHRGSVWRREEIEEANRALGETNILPASVRYVVASIHPAAIIHRERLEKFSAMGYRKVPSIDFRRLAECVRKGRTLARVECVEGEPPWAPEREPFVFDIETVGRGAEQRIDWVGIQHLDGGPVYGGEMVRMRGWLRAACEGEGRKVGHNIVGFDIPRLWELEGIEVRPPFEDTIIMAGMCEADLARGLHFQQALYLGDRRPFHKELVTDKKHWRRQVALRAAWRRLVGDEMPEHTELMMTEKGIGQFYNAADVDSTRLIHGAMGQRARKEGWA